MRTGVVEGPGSSDRFRAAGTVGRVTTAAPTREDVAAVVDLALLTALDPAISAAAIRDALIVLASRPAPAPPTVEPLVVLAHARAEVWRQLRARGIHPDSAPDVRVDAEALSSLTPAERTTLYLMTRRALPAHDVGFILDVSTREARRLHRRAQVALVRAVTGLALAMDLTPCLIRDELAARGAGMLSRRDIDALTMHAAECRICVEWLRRADHQALAGYDSMAAPTDREIDVVLANLQQLGEEERLRVVARAGALRRDGRPPRESLLLGDPKRWMRRGISLGVTSVVLVVVGVLAMAR